MNLQNIKNVLLVDDEPINLFAVKSLLRRYYTVFTATDPVLALEIIKKEEIDLVLSDQLMPGMTGVKLLAAIMNENPSIRRFILTAYNGDDELKNARKNRIVDFILEKPFEINDLEEALKSRL